MSTLEFGFTEDDLIPLILHVTDGDTAGIVSWLEEHVKRHHDMHALMEFVGRFIYSTWPMALTKGAKLGEGDFWAMQVQSSARPVAVTTTQILTASLNADWDTLTALINATLSKPEEFHGAVMAHLLAALGDGLNAIAESADPSYCPPLAPGDDETCTHTPTCPPGSSE